MWIINTLGLLLIAAIVWWFWLYKPRDVATSAGGVVEIVVENGVYVPARVEIPLGRPTTLRFLRKDSSPCAATVVFSEFDISEELPANRPKDVVVNPGRTGSFPFTCQMQMYRGELRVVEQKSNLEE